MPESITAFDGIALAVVVISAIMGFARGFLRELATLGAFIGALAAAYYARAFFHDDLAALLPPDAAAQALRDAMVIAVEGHVAAPGSEGSHDDSLEAAIQQALAEANAAGLQLLATACPECGAQVLCRIDPLALIEAESTRHDVVGEAQQLSTSLGWTLGRVLALPESRRRTLAAALASGASA